MKKCNNDECKYLSLDAILKPKNGHLPPLRTRDAVLELLSRFVDTPSGIVGVARVFFGLDAYDIDSGEEHRNIKVPQMALRPSGCSGIELIINKLKEISGDRNIYLITDISVGCCEKKAMDGCIYHEF